MIFNYCPICGSRAVDKIIGDEGNIPYCVECKKPLFPFSYTCILTLIIDENHNFAFIQQNNIPLHLYMGVAGYQKIGETLEDTVKREVFEEVGLVVKSTNYVKSYYYTKKDLLMVGYVSKVAHSEFRLSEEVDNAKWFRKEEVKKVLREKSIIQSLFNDYISSLNKI